MITRSHLLAALAVGPAAIASAYQLLLLAASVPRSRPPRPASGELPFTILVPAHDEEPVIGGTLASLAALDYPPARVRTVVIADNCSDDTAAIARAAGVEVLERDDPARPGKGRALAWALERLGAGTLAASAVVIIDADCTASPNLLRAFAARFAAGARAVQADYVVANPDESPAAALRYAGFALVNGVRPRGRTRLGLSCGLLGTGMGFAPGLLREVPWTAFSLAEDAEQHLELVAAGELVVFCPEAAVRSPMPTTFAASAGQQSRWEAGRLWLARRFAVRLIAAGVIRRDPARLAAGTEQLVPPTSLLAAATLTAGSLAVVLRARGAAVTAALSMLAQVVYIVGGLAVVRAPRSVFRSLAQAPVLLLGKLRLYTDVAVGRGPRAWVRTERERTTPAQVKSSAVGKA